MGRQLLGGQRGRGQQPDLPLPPGMSTNQTYLYLQVSGDLIFLGRIETFIVVTQDGGAAGAAIDALLCSEPATSPPPPVTTQHAPGTAAEIRSPVTNMCLHVASTSDNPEVEFREYRERDIDSSNVPHVRTTRMLTWLSVTARTGRSGTSPPRARSSTSPPASDASL